MTKRLEWKQDKYGYTNGCINDVHFCYFTKAGYGEPGFIYGLYDDFRVDGSIFADCGTEEEVKAKGEADLVKWLNNIPGVEVKE